METAREGMLRMLKEAAALYGARYLLPFASHFTLWHPSHREYVRAMRRNTLDDIVRAFEESDVRVVDLLPGESWDASTFQFSRLWRERARLYEPDQVMRYLDRRFDAQEFARHHPVASDLN